MKFREITENHSIFYPVFLLGVCFLAQMLLTGCAVGYNSTLFVTKSNVGLDVDTKPPTLELSIARVEGVIQPTFEGGKTLPVMASFKPEIGVDRLITSRVSQTFSTGQAAVVMADLYDSPKAPKWNEVDYQALVKQASVKVKKKPEVSGTYPILNYNYTRNVDFVEPGMVRPVFFGTNTTLGIKASWTGEGGGLPDSASIGYKRKEIAIAPIGYIPCKPANDEGIYEGEGRMAIPSLLATIEQSSELGASGKTEQYWLQYFATGRSATELALQPNVRKAMLARLDPDFGVTERSLGLLTLALKEFESPDSAFSQFIDPDLVTRLDAAAVSMLPRYLVFIGEKKDRRAIPIAGNGQDDGAEPVMARVLVEKRDVSVKSARGLISAMNRCEQGLRTMQNALTGGDAFYFQELGVETPVLVTQDNQAAYQRMLNEKKEIFKKLRGQFVELDIHQEVVDAYLAFLSRQED